MQFNHKTMRLLMAFLVSILVSCSKSSDNSGTPPGNTTDATVLLKNDSHFGQILTDASGRSLYFFAIDANGSSGCNDACATTWPPFYESVIDLTGTSLDAADFATIDRSDGSKQITYKGWPLYRYSGDVQSGGGYNGPVTNSVSGDAIGGIWFVAKPDYTIMLAKTQLVGLDGKQYDSTYTENAGATLYMTDDKGITLYAFSHDSSANNNYTAADFSNDDFWPIVQLAAVQNVPSVLNKADFSSITVFGKTQLTYKGWPVYRFGPDELTRGNNKGISVPTPGIWPVMDQFSPDAPHL